MQVTIEARMLQFIAFLLLAASATATFAGDPHPRLAQSPAAGTSATPADAEVRPFIEGYPIEVAQTIGDVRARLREAGIGDPGTTKKGVINGHRLWFKRKYPRLLVCFNSGPEETRRRVAAIAGEWTQVVPNLVLDFGKAPALRQCAPGDGSHIRVAFARGGQDGGHWSLIGTESMEPAQIDKPSMNIDLSDPSLTQDRILRSVVLHEFGHALGLEHEHQNPHGPCQNDLDWEAIYKATAKQGWSKDAARFNIGVLLTAGIIAEPPFDTKSVMLYELPLDYFSNKSSSCIYSRNASLSDGDRRMGAQLYPKTKKEEDDLLDRIRRHSKEQIASSAKGATLKSELLRLIDDLIPDPEK